MSLIGSAAVQGQAVLPQSTPQATQPTSTSGGRSFKDVVQKLENGPDMHKEIINLQKGLMEGREFSPRELLVYQIKASQYHMRVELVTKLAESALATTKKFQTGQ